METYKICGEEIVTAAQDQLTIYLVEAFDFCWGDERRVQMVYEAVRVFPGKKVNITNEIIHNPEVNQHMRKMNL